MFNRDKWDVFITLTFSNKLTNEQVRRTLHRYFMHIERACFGRQAKVQKLFRAPVIEETAEATHVHILMIKPHDRKHSWFRDLLRSKWCGLNGVGKANLRKGNLDERGKWYQLITNTDVDRDKVIAYITKYVPKDYSTVDFENTVTMII